LRRHATICLPLRGLRTTRCHASCSVLRPHPEIRHASPRIASLTEAHKGNEDRGLTGNRPPGEARKRQDRRDNGRRRSAAGPIAEAGCGVTGIPIAVCCEQCQVIVPRGTRDSPWAGYRGPDGSRIPTSRAGRPERPQDFPGWAPSSVAHRPESRFVVSIARMMPAWIPSSVAHRPESRFERSQGPRPWTLGARLGHRLIARVILAARPSAAKPVRASRWTEPDHEKIYHGVVVSSKRRPPRGSGERLGR